MILDWIIIVLYLIDTAWSVAHLRLDETVPVFPRWFYYLLSLTWGLPITVIGAAAAIILLICGKKPVVYGWNLYFPLEINWGLSLGLVCIVPKQNIGTTWKHEHGHSFQNACLGPWMLLVVAIPSMIRFWYREIMAKRHKELPPYDAIWFERQATQTGVQFMNNEKGED